MGYNTEYKVSTSGNHDKLGDLLKEMTQEYFSDRGTYFYVQSKWYESREDLIKVSKKLPLDIITCYGNGEEFPDVWVHYFQDGKDELFKAEITYPLSTFKVPNLVEKIVPIAVLNQTINVIVRCSPHATNDDIQDLARELLAYELGIDT